jgi:hypothetical protein
MQIYVTFIKLFWDLGVGVNYLYANLCVKVLHMPLIKFHNRDVIEH